jgi:hypothetical protein
VQLSRHLEKLDKYRHGITPEQREYDEEEDLLLHILGELVSIHTLIRANVSNVPGA